MTRGAGQKLLAELDAACFYGIFNNLWRKAAAIQVCWIAGTRRKQNLADLSYFLPIYLLFETLEKYRNFVSPFVTRQVKRRCEDSPRSGKLIPRKKEISRTTGPNSTLSILRKPKKENETHVELLFQFTAKHRFYMVFMVHKRVHRMLMYVGYIGSYERLLRGLNVHEATIKVRCRRA